MDLYVIQSERFSNNHYFIVDENNLNEKILNNQEYKRIQLEEELNTLGIFMCGGDDRFEIIKGKPYDFFIALLKKTFK